MSLCEFSQKDSYTGVVADDVYRMADGGQKVGVVPMAMKCRLAARIGPSRQSRRRSRSNSANFTIR